VLEDYAKVCERLEADLTGATWWHSTIDWIGAFARMLFYDDNDNELTYLFSLSRSLCDAGPVKADSFYKACRGNDTLLHLISRYCIRCVSLVATKA